MEGRPAKPRPFWWAAGSAALMLVGAVGPWARVLSVVSVNGTDGDGWFVIGAAVLAAFALFRFWQRGPTRWLYAAAAGGVVGCLVAAYDLSELRRVAGGTAFGDSSFVTAGWGIYLDVVASAGLAVFAVLLARTAPAAALPAGDTAGPAT